jgi:hypothetical protein
VTDNLEKAWKDYIKANPYSLTEPIDPWIPFKWAWDAAMKVCREAVDGN